MSSLLLPRPGGSSTLDAGRLLGTAAAAGLLRLIHLCPFSETSLARQGRTPRYLRFALFSSCPWTFAPKLALVPKKARGHQTHQEVDLQELFALVALPAQEEASALQSVYGGH